MPSQIHEALIRKAEKRIIVQSWCNAIAHLLYLGHFAAARGLWLIMAKKGISYQTMTAANVDVKDIRAIERYREFLDKG